MTFITVSGSLYEVNLDTKQVRRLIGIKDPTPRQGEDGNWREYKEITPITTGHPVVFIWNFLIDRAESTMTSIVKEIRVTNEN